MRTITATRYVTPLREGGSLPAIVEADDDGLYVLKFRGAGQGRKALIAELIGGEFARAAGLPMPEIVFMQLDAELARTEPDPEIQDLIRASAGLNLALDYLPGAVAFDPLVHHPEPELASAIVWHDAFLNNVDRTPRNSNLLMWHRKLWLIDHGAALTFHHQWDGYLERGANPFAMIKDHVLLGRASSIAEADVERGEFVNAGVIVACASQGFLKARVALDEARLLALDPAADIASLQAALAAIPATCAGGKAAGPIGRLSVRERFDWLVAPRSTSIQISPVHSGRVADLDAALERLMDRMVRRPGAAATGG